MKMMFHRYTMCNICYIVFLIINIIVSINASSNKTVVDIGAIFNVFNILPGSVFSRNEQQCQHVAAFLLAVYEINNDPKFDTITVNEVLNIGDTLSVSYPYNPYFDGAYASFYIHETNSIVAVIDTVSVETQAKAVSATANAFNIVTLLSTCVSSLFKDSVDYPYTLQIISSYFTEAYYLSLVIEKYNWNKVAVIYSTDIEGLASLSSFSLGNVNILGNVCIYCYLYLCCLHLY